MNKVVIVACTNVGRQIILEILKNNSINTRLVGVINLNSKSAINKSNYDNYNDLKKKFMIKIKYINNINHSESINWIKKIKPELIIQSGWSQKFNSKVLKLAKYGCVGEHPAPLPYGQGAACVNWGIIKGRKKWGDTFFLMNNKYDDGPILSQKFFKISNNDTVKTVYDKISYTSVLMIRENIDKWSNGNFRKIKQNKNKAVYFKKRLPEQGEFKLEDDPKKIIDKIRALTHPYPGAFFIYKKKKIFVWDANHFMRSEYDKKITYFLKSKKNFEKYKNDFLLIKVGIKKNKIIKLNRVQVDDEPEIWASELKI